MKRIFDCFFTAVLVLLLLPLILLIAILVFFTTNGSILYWSDRVGAYNRIFKMPKFRSMQLGTPEVATHLLHDSSNRITRFGCILRKYSLDEIPQLWCILKGDMSFVGPRPALYNQYDLIDLRTSNNVHVLVPGLTGWAQVNGRDALSILQKVKFDTEYKDKKSFFFDLYILWLTITNIKVKD